MTEQISPRVRDEETGRHGRFTAGIEKGEPYELYLVTNPAALARSARGRLNLRPFGIRIQPVDFRAETFEFRRADHEVARLLELFRLAHARSTSDPERVLPRWMIVDLVLMPAGILLAVAGQDHVASVARELERGESGPSSRPNWHRDREKAAALRDLLQVAHNLGYVGPLPVAGYAALPTPVPGRWVGGSLWWSLVPHCGLGYSVRRIALECYRARQEIGVTQFDNAEALHAQRRFGALRVTHTNLAAHPRRHTFVYEVDVKALPAAGWPATQPDASQIVTTAPITDPPSRPVIHPGLWQDGPQQPAGKRRPRKGDEKADQHLTPGIRTGDPYRPYIISNETVFGNLDLSPFGIKLHPIDLRASTFPADGTDYPVAVLLDLLSRAIAFSYAESGLGMPRWAMVELALMSSAVVLVMAGQEHLRKVADQLAHEPVTRNRRTPLIPLAEDDADRIRNGNSLRFLLEAARDLDYKGPLPIAGYTATATPRPGRWVGWSLWSLVPGQRLGYTVKRLGLACYRVRSQTAVMQFSMARGVDVITKFGRPSITAAHVRPHPLPHAFIYELKVNRLRPDASPIRPRPRHPTPRQLDPGDPELAHQLQAMQREIERGTQYYLLQRSAGKARSPIIPLYRRTLVHRAIRYRGKLLLARLRRRARARIRRLTDRFAWRLAPQRFR